MPDTYFPGPPGAPRRPAKESLDMLQEHAREAVQALGSIDMAPTLQKALSEMNGRDAVLAQLLTEAHQKIDRLEATVSLLSLLLQTASCLIDDLAELKETNQKEEGK